ncbi:hypothetical protein MJH12_11355, partial [bacterium]|nr:hypothetical protein [bacterium]
MIKKILLICSIVFPIIPSVVASIPIQIVYGEAPKNFMDLLHRGLENSGFKVVGQKNVSKEYIQRKMIRLELHLFLSALPLFRQTEFGTIGKASHNPF